MRRCLSCAAIYPVGMHCANCGQSPEIVDGFESHAPVLAHGGAGFEASYFADLARLEDGNFWFEARNQLILWAMKRHVPDLASFFEIGCGTGFVLSGIAREFPHASLLGSEVFTAGLGFAARRVPAATFMQMDARRIPFHEEFDGIGAFDVLEHIEEDTDVLAEIWRALKPGGCLFLTVPQHQWLWSVSDEHARHVRRYAAPDLHSKLKRTGFDILRSTSFVSLLLPLMYLSRARNRSVASDSDPAKEFKLPGLVNAAFYRVMKAESGLLRMGINLPMGGSRLVVARKSRGSDRNGYDG